jgi:hypothetical protein
MSTDVSQYRICAQKMLPKELKMLERIATSNIPKEQASKLRAISMKGKIWPQGKTLYIKFLQRPPQNLSRTWGPNKFFSDPSRWPTIDKNGNTIRFDPLEKELFNKDIITCIKKIVNERLNPIINLNFVFADDVKYNGRCDIRISFDPNQGAWSYVGTDNTNIRNQNQPTMNLGWYDVPTVLHEFCHALGLAHEHQSPSDCPKNATQKFKDQFCNKINWNLAALYNWASKSQGWSQKQTKDQIVYRYSMTEVNGTDFDPLSIMLYFYPKEVTDDNKGTSMNTRLSKLDVTYLNSLYPGSPSISKRVEEPNDFYFKVYGEYINSGETTTMMPTTMMPTTMMPTTMMPTTMMPTTMIPTTMEPTTIEPTTMEPTTIEPTTMEPEITVVEVVETVTTSEPVIVKEATTAARNGLKIFLNVIFGILGTVAAICIIILFISLLLGK